MTVAEAYLPVTHSDSLCSVCDNIGTMDKSNRVARWSLIILSLVVGCALGIRVGLAVIEQRGKVEPIHQYEYFDNKKEK